MRWWHRFCHPLKVTTFYFQLVMGSKTLVLKILLNTGRLLSEVAYSSTMYPWRWFRQTVQTVLLINAIQFKMKYTSKLLKEEISLTLKNFIKEKYSSVFSSKILSTQIFEITLFKIFLIILLWRGWMWHYNRLTLCIFVKTFIALLFIVFSAVSSNSAESPTSTCNVNHSFYNYSSIIQFFS